MSNNIKNNSKNPKQTVAYLPSLGRLLGFSSKITTDLSEKMLLPSGITIKQWILLTSLWRKDGQTVGELAVYYRASEPSTSNLIARMEKKGLLDRRHDKLDRRQVKVFLTDQGKSLSHLIDFFNDVNEVLLEGFDEAEKAQFSAMLEKLIANAQNGLKKL